MRLFIAAPISRELREALSAALERVRTDLSTMPVKWVAPENLHLTFHFLGETPEPAVDAITKRLRGACANFPALDVLVAGLGCFPDFSRPKVVWVGLRDAGRLAKLQRAIHDATAEFGEQGGAARSKPDRTTFSPHLTLGRVRDTSSDQRRRLGRELQRQNLGELGWWRMDRVTLMRSELSPAGPCYRELASVALPVS